MHRCAARTSNTELFCETLIPIDNKDEDRHIRVRVGLKELVKKHSRTRGVLVEVPSLAVRLIATEEDLRFKFQMSYLEREQILGNSVRLEIRSPYDFDRRLLELFLHEVRGLWKHGM